MSQPRTTVLTRVPVPGRTKTRLIPALGPEGAARIAAAMAADVLDAVRASGLPFRVAIDGPLDHPWVRGLDAQVEAQADGDLGARIAHALRDGGLAIGTDAPTLPASLLRDAACALDDADVVLSPAEDGGYALVGCRAAALRGPSGPEGRVIGLFDDLPWSSPDTLSAQLSRAHSMGLRVRMLPAVADVDTPEDLARLRLSLACLPPTIAPRTRALLESHHAAPLR